MVIINIDQGCLKGKTGQDYNGRRYHSFLGIPYAKPPIGELRFKVGNFIKCQYYVVKCGKSYHNAIACILVMWNWFFNNADP